MKKSLQILAILVVLLLISLAFVDKTFLHMSGLKAVEHATPQAAFKKVVAPKDQAKKEYNAGYQWAEDNQVVSLSQCKGTKDFIKGCAAYIDDNVDDTQQDNDDPNDE